MVTLTEDYVSFETALLLKKKEFEQVGCQKQYNTQGDLCVGYCYGPVAPTHQMAMKWLREVHGIFICIEFDAPTFVADIYKMDEIDEYGCAKHIPPTIANCQTYEEACEAAIKYCLENLI